MAVLRTKRPQHYQQCIFSHKNMSYEFWSSVQYVSPFIALLQEIQCTYENLTLYRYMYKEKKENHNNTTFLGTGFTVHGTQG